MDRDPFVWAASLEWHRPAHRAVMASAKLGGWLSAALDDPAVCEAMKADIREWFSAGEPMETLCQIIDHQREVQAELLSVRQAIIAAEEAGEGWYSAYEAGLAAISKAPPRATTSGES